MPEADTRSEGTLPSVQCSAAWKIQDYAGCVEWLPLSKIGGRRSTPDNVLNAMGTI